MMDEHKTKVQLIKEIIQLRQRLSLLEMTENERLIAENTFLNERYLFSTFMDNMLDPIYFKDVKSRYIRINKAQAFFLGLDDPSEALGMTDFDFFPKEEAQIAYENELRVIETGRILIKEERKTNGFNGSHAWYLVTKLPLKNKQGQVIGTFGINQDITIQKEAEMAFARNAKSLDQ